MFNRVIWTVLGLAIMSCGGGPAQTSEPVANQAAPQPRSTADAEVDHAQVNDAEVNDAEANAHEAREAVAKAERDAAEASARLEAIQRQVIENMKAIESAIAALEAAERDLNRKAAKTKLSALQRAQAELEKNIAAAKAAAIRAERAKGNEISKECQDNPLAEGCS